MKKGFTLIELLVVIAIIAILAAILFPVFARAREKARQTTCTSNQKQIAAAVMMYTQDHEETLPATTIFWSAITVDPGVLKCPSKGINVNAYVYNADLSGTALGDFENPANQFLTMDGESKSGGGTGILKNWITDSDPRHSGKVIQSYLDGHVTQADAPWRIADEATLSLWMKASTLVKNGCKDGDVITAWTDNGPNNRTAVQAASANAPMLKISGCNGNPAVVFNGKPMRSMTVPTVTSLGDVTVFVVLKCTPDPACFQQDIKAVSMGNAPYTFAIYRKGYNADWRTSAYKSSDPYYMETKATSIADNKVHILAATKAAGNQSLFADGNYIDKITGVGAVSTGTFTIGAAASAGQNDTPGIWISEIVILNKLVDDKIMGIATKELKERYSIQ